jgi:hypothetical protein
MSVNKNLMKDIQRTARGQPPLYDVRTSWNIFLQAYQISYDKGFPNYMKLRKSIQVIMDSPPFDSGKYSQAFVTEVI